MLGGLAAPTMFNFGTPEDTAILLWDRASLVPGPDLYFAPLEEMTREELRMALNYARVAITYGSQEGHPQEVIDILLGQYDEIFSFLIPVDEEFSEYVLSGKFLPPSGARKYYQGLARTALSES